MVSTDEVRSVLGGTAYGSGGDTLGKVGQVYLDDQTGQPEWATISTGLFGTKASFVPLAQAQVSGNELRVPYDKDMVKGAPRVDVDQGHLSETEEAELYRYYGLDYSEAGSDSGLPAGTAATTGTSGTMGTAGTTGGRGDRDRDGMFDDVEGRAVGRDTSGPSTDDAMTRSEEQLRVGTERVQAGRARLRTFVVTENVTQTVPVTHEQVRVEREPITDANIGQAMDGQAISEEEHEVVLHEERPVVAKEAVPVERVRLDKQTVTEQQTVGGEVRKEQIEVEGGDENHLRR